MNKMEIVHRFMREARMPDTRPPSSVNPTQQVLRCIDWCDSAWMEIQGMYDSWDFMRGDFIFNTEANKGDYTRAEAGLTDHRYWLADTFRVYKTSIGKSDDQFLHEWEYNVFRDTYRYGPQVDSRPFVFAIRPRDSALMFGPAPEDVYTIYGEYIKRAVPLATDNSVPSMGPEYHMLIVWKALMTYALDVSAAELLSKAELNYGRLMPQLERQSLPDITFREPMA